MAFWSHPNKDGVLYYLGNLLFRDYLINDSYPEALRGWLWLVERVAPGRWNVLGVA